MKFKRKSHKALKVSGIDIPSFYDMISKIVCRCPQWRRKRWEEIAERKTKKHGTYKIRVTVKEPCMSSGKRREVRYTARWDI